MMLTMALQLYQMPLTRSLSSSSHSHPLFFQSHHYTLPSFNERLITRLASIFRYHNALRRRKTGSLLVGKEDIELSVQDDDEEEEDQEEEEEEEEEEAPPPSPQDLQYVQDIKRVAFIFSFSFLLSSKEYHVSQ